LAFAMFNPQWPRFVPLFFCSTFWGLFFIFLTNLKSFCEEVVLQTFVQILCFIQNTNVHATTNVYHVDMVHYNKNNHEEMVWILQAKNNHIDFFHVTLLTWLMVLVSFGTQ
jgi:hypothetical protein